MLAGTAAKLKRQTVQNKISDGRVEIVAQAPKAMLDEFLVDIKGYFMQYLTDIDLKEEPPAGELNDFIIKR